MHLMEGVRQFSGYVRKYVVSLQKISLQAREFSLIVRYYLIINGTESLYTCYLEFSW